MNNLVRLTVVSILAGLMAAPPAFAQLEEIIVTATRREESLQDVPISVTALTGVALQEGGFSDMDDLSIFIPNLYMRDTFVGQRLAIRGIGTSPSNEAFEQAVAQFHDGIYYGRDNLGQNTFFDLERLEVVRGPQPTFAGQSATAGAINTISRRPGDTMEGNVTLAYGSDEETTFEFGVGGPLSDTFGIRVAGRAYELGDAGYTQVTTGEPLGIRDNSAFRITGVWTPSDNFELTLKYESQDVWQVGTPTKFSRCDLNPATSLGNPFLSAGFGAMCAIDHLYNGVPLVDSNGLVGSGGFQDIWDAVAAIDAANGITDPNDPSSWTPAASPVARNMNNVREFLEPEERDHQADIFLASFDWLIGEYTLSSITSSVSYDKHDWLDPDASSFAVFSDERIEFFDQSAQEFRLSSSQDQAFVWMVGAYYQDHELDTVIDIFAPRVFGHPLALALGPPNLRGTGYGSQLIENSTWNSMFFAGDWNVAENVRVNIGARYQDVDKTGVLTPTIGFLTVEATEYTDFVPFPAGIADPIHESFATSDTLPELGLEWDVGDDSMLYVRYAEAFKAGGFVMAPAPGGMFARQLTYRPEFAEGVELGLKSRMLDGTLELNLAYFDTDYTDLQVTVFRAETSSFETTNAGAANTSGLEIDGRWAPSTNFTMGFSGAIGDAMYVSYEGADECNSLEAKIGSPTDGSTGGSCVVDLSGEKMPNTPDWSITLSPQINFGLSTNLAGSVSGMILFSDGYRLTDDRDPLNILDPFQRVDLRFAVAPTDGNWEIALYGRDMTNDVGLKIGGGGRTFQSRTRAPDYDAGGISYERGARYGVQFSYFMGN